MEQGRARERATVPGAAGVTGATEPTEHPHPPTSTSTSTSTAVPSYGGAVRVPEQARGAAAGVPPAGASTEVRGEHTHSEPPVPRLLRAPAAAASVGVPDPAFDAASALGGSPRTVRRHSVRGQILQALRTALVGGELAPGEVYSAPVLAERFGVSATPVREAMQQLAVEGAVEVVPNRGFRVTERTPRELAELAEVRALIEVPVMLRLARTVPAARWAELKPLAEATATAAARGDRAHYAEADRAFHRAVLSLAGNQQLLAIADDLHRRSQWPLVSGPVTRHGDLVADAAEHTALLDALIAQDVTVVQSLVREHFTGSAE
ncbi:GntR family transcriptional regulator [Streptomyces sp. NPDC054975]